MRLLPAAAGSWARCSTAPTRRKIARTTVEVVADRDALELALFLIGSRGYLLPALHARKIRDRARRGAGTSGARTTRDRPCGFAGIAIARSLYPPDHSYYLADDQDRLRGRPAATLGERGRVLPEDLSPGQRVDRAGRHDRQDAGSSLVRKIFRGAPGGPPVGPVTPPAIPAQTQEIRLVHGSDQAPQLYLAWRSAGACSPRATRPMIRWRKSRGGKTSRPVAAVHEKHLALDIARAAAIARARRHVPGDRHRHAWRHARHHRRGRRRGDRRADESRALGRRDVAIWRQAEARFICRLQTVGGSNGKSDRLNACNVYHRGPWLFRSPISNATGACRSTTCAPRRAAPPTQRVALSVVPGQASLALAGLPPKAVVS